MIRTKKIFKLSVYTKKYHFNIEDNYEGQNILCQCPFNEIISVSILEIRTGSHMESS
jgi:hypothetical protein